MALHTLLYKKGEIKMSLEHLVFALWNNAPRTIIGEAMNGRLVNHGTVKGDGEFYGPMDVYADNMYEKIGEVMKDFRMHRKENIVCKDINKIYDLQDIFNSLGTTYIYDGDALFLLGEEFVMDITFEKSKDYQSLWLTVYTVSNAKYDEAIAKLKESLKSYLHTDKVCFVNFLWYYCNGKGSIERTFMEEKIDDKIYANAYPYIENMDKYIDDYIKSNEQVLLLMGPAGVGKSTFLREVIKRYDAIDENKKTAVFYTNDQRALMDDEMFIDFMNSESSLMILEDIDYDLKTRKENNPFMYKLLAASDGIIHNTNKKIILSTNLSSITDIDAALLRPGRCYDVIKARALTKEESIAFLNNFGLKRTMRKDNYTLAELYRFINRGEVKDTDVNKGVGF